MVKYSEILHRCHVIRQLAPAGAIGLETTVLPVRDDHSRKVYED